METPSADHSWPDLIWVGGMSRSGTTLLCAMLESSSSIAMAAELFGPRTVNLGVELDRIPDLHTCGPQELLMLSATSDLDDTEFGKTLQRWSRGGLTGVDLLHARSQCTVADHTSVLYQATFYAHAMRSRARREGRSFFGMKWNTGGPNAALENFADCRMIAMTRHPSDIVHSHHRVGMEKPPAAVLTAWAKTVRTYARLATHHPQQVTLIRYEDLIRDPRGTVQKHLTVLGLPFEDSMLRHETSESAILRGQHLNHATLNRPVQRPEHAIPRSPLHLPDDLADADRALVVEQMAAIGYSDSAVLERPHNA
jgi:hypothetical protein